MGNLSAWYIKFLDTLRVGTAEASHELEEWFQLSAAADRALRTGTDYLREQRRAEL